MKLTQGLTNPGPQKLNPKRLEKRMNDAGGSLYFDDGFVWDSKIEGETFEKVLKNENWGDLGHKVYVKYEGKKEVLDSSLELAAAVDYMDPQSGTKAELFRSIESEGLKPQELYDTYTTADLYLNMGRPSYSTMANQDANPLGAYVDFSTHGGDTLFLMDEAGEENDRSLTIRDENWKFKAFESGIVTEDPSLKFREDSETLKKVGIGFKGASYEESGEFKDPIQEQLFHQGGRDGYFTIDGASLQDSTFTLDPSEGLQESWNSFEGSIDQLREFDRPSNNALNFLRRNKSESKDGDKINLWREKKLAGGFQYLKNDQEKSVYLQLSQKGLEPKNVDSALQQLREGRDADEVLEFFSKSK